MYTPDEYAAHIEKTFASDDCTVIDFYAIPDYAEFLGPCVDRKFSRYCKQEFTQHQFIFEKVEKSEHFPLGCKTSYRAYASDSVVEIKEEPNEFFPQVNMVAYQAKPIRTYPTASIDSDGTVLQPAGMYLSTELCVSIKRFFITFGFSLKLLFIIAGMTITCKAPFRSKDSIVPHEFTKGSRSMYDATTALFRSTFSANFPHVVQKWEEWEQKFVPKDDNAMNYIRE